MYKRSKKTTLQTIIQKRVDKQSCLVYNTQAAENASVAELADARDLKSRGTQIPYRFEPGFRHHISRGRAAW